MNELFKLQVAREIVKSVETGEFSMKFIAGNNGGGTFKFSFAFVTVQTPEEVAEINCLINKYVTGSGK